MTFASRPAIFTQGSLLRHLLVMTSTSSLGFIAIFSVDVLSLMYISWLGDPHLIAGVSYAAQILFLMVSINLGFSIATSALISQRVGAGNMSRARVLASSILIHILVTSTCITLPFYLWRSEILDILGARGDVHLVALEYLGITLPSTIAMSAAMMFAAVLRALGDARRAMYVTLIGGILTALLDPLFIFGFGWGVQGAAWATALSRFIWLAIGSWGVFVVHKALARPRWYAIWQDLSPLLKIATPAILTNLAAPVAIIYSMRVFSIYGPHILASFAMSDRVMPLAFCPLFAMPASLGPIIGQNYGALLTGRVRKVFVHALIAAIIYALLMWGLLWLLCPLILHLFHAEGETAQFFTFFCTWGTPLFVFLGCLFTSNAAFNNLGYPILSTVFNWGRATLGTIPLVTYGAYVGGPEGGVLGLVLGAAIFACLASATAYWVSGRPHKSQRGKLE